MDEVRVCTRSIGSFLEWDNGYLIIGQRAKFGSDKFKILFSFCGSWQSHNFVNASMRYRCGGANSIWCFVLEAERRKRGDSPAQLTAVH